MQHCYRKCFRWLWMSVCEVNQCSKQFCTVCVCVCVCVCVGWVGGLGDPDGERRVCAVGERCVCVCVGVCVCVEVCVLVLVWVCVCVCVCGFCIRGECVCVRIVG